MKEFVPYWWIHGAKARRTGVGDRVLITVELSKARSPDAAVMTWLSELDPSWREWFQDFEWTAQLITSEDD